jgi:hypothetical protein
MSQLTESTTFSPESEEENKKEEEDETSYEDSWFFYGGMCKKFGLLVKLGCAESRISFQESIRSMQRDMGSELDTFCIPIRRHETIKLRELETIWFFYINQQALHEYGHSVHYDVSIGPL